MILTRRSEGAGAEGMPKEFSRMTRSGAFGMAGGTTATGWEGLVSGIFKNKPITAKTRMAANKAMRIESGIPEVLAEV